MRSQTIGSLAILFATAMWGMTFSFIKDAVSILSPFNFLFWRLQLKFQRFVTPTKTAIIFSTEPLFATLTAALYLHEKLTLNFYIGALLIFSAVLLSEQLLRRKVIPQD